MLEGERLSRRSFLGGALATAGVGGLLVAGCGGGDKRASVPSAAATAGQPKRGGTIRQSSTAPILSIDPNTVEGVGVAVYMYSYLVAGTDWQGIVGDLALSWEVPDQINWIFKIRSDVRFQDIPPVGGRALAAEDIAKSIERLKTLPETAGAVNQWADKAEAPDPTTLALHAKKPYGYLLYALGGPLAAVVPMDAVDAFGDLKSQAIGSGPFMLHKYGRNEGLDMVRNPLYYHDYPYVDGYNIMTIGDDASAQAAFRAGQLDVYIPPHKLTADSMKNVNGASVQSFLSRTYAVLALNGVKVEAFKDLRVREAVDLLLDRQEMINKLYSGAGELAGPVPPLWDSSLPKSEVEQAYKRDVAKAKSLLSAAGREGLRFSLSCSTFGGSTVGADLASIIKSNLAEADITVDIQAQELGTWLANLVTGNYEATTFEHLPYLSDEIQLGSQHSLGVGRNQAGYLGVDDPEVDAELTQIQETIDDKERLRLAQDVQRKILRRHGPTLVLYEPYGYWAAYDYIKGYTPTAYGFGLFKFDYWIDKG
jgi:peptide/nickel transport system substrate-binding protein